MSDLDASADPPPTDEAHSESAARSRFVAAMSHEMRTPLNAIVGFGELLSSGSAGPLTERQSRYLENITRAARNLSDMVSDVLDLAALEAGELRLAPSAVDIPESLRRVLQKTEALTAARHQSVRLEAPAGLSVWADQKRFEQVIWNLLDNASKFTPVGGRLAVRAGRLPSGELLVEVEDDGIGIAGEDRERIFEEFTQIDAGLTRRRGGTGLGLTLGRRLLDLMGGSLQLRDAAGGGSVFSVRLPGRSV